MVDRGMSWADALAESYVALELLLALILAHLTSSFVNSKIWIPTRDFFKTRFKSDDEDPSTGKQETAPPLDGRQQ